MKSIRILLVQAEKVARERLLEQLERKQYTIVQANNGAEGLALFRRGEFDLVITGYEMAFLDGGELATQVKSLDPLLPVLMVSSLWQRPSRENPVDASLHLACHPSRFHQVVAELLLKAKQTHPDRPIPHGCEPFAMAEDAERS